MAATQTLSMISSIRIGLCKSLESTFSGRTFGCRRKSVDHRFCVFCATAASGFVGVNAPDSGVLASRSLSADRLSSGI